MSDQPADYVLIPKQTLEDTIRLFNECDWTIVCSEVSELLDYFRLLIDGSSAGGSMDG